MDVIVKTHEKHESRKAMKTSFLLILINVEFLKDCATTRVWLKN